jgi:tryptophan synthase beta chain
MELLGAKVVAVKTGTSTLNDAVDEALNDLIQNYKSTYYMLGSAVGPDPYPEMAKYFQSIIGREVKEQITGLEGRLPDYR